MEKLQLSNSYASFNRTRTLNILKNFFGQKAHFFTAALPHIAINFVYLRYLYDKCNAWHSKIYIEEKHIEGFCVKLYSCTWTLVMDGDFLFKATDSSLLTPRTRFYIKLSFRWYVICFVPFLIPILPLAHHGQLRFLLRNMSILNHVLKLPNKLKSLLPQPLFSKCF